MGLAAALSQVPEPEVNNKCGVRIIRESIFGDDLVAFNNALELVWSQPRGARSGRSTGATTKWLAQVLNDNGHQITAHTLQRHLRGECACGII